MGAILLERGPVPPPILTWNRIGHSPLLLLRRPRIAGILLPRSSDRCKLPAGPLSDPHLPNSGSIYRGVSWDPTTQQWQVLNWIALRSQWVCMGHFADEKQAARAHDQLSVHIHGR